jgi:hypothetical protein
MKHFYLRDETGFPVACVASEIAGDGDAKHIRFAMSIRNPLDVYDRQRGRSIAEARLTKGKDVVTTALSPAVKHNIMEAIRVRNLPQRVREAAAHWLATHPLLERRPLGN